MQIRKRFSAHGLALLLALGLFSSPAAAGETRFPSSARQAMDRLVRALQAGDLVAAEREALPAAEWAALSTRPVNASAWQEAQRGFLRLLSRELAGGARVERLELADTLLLPKDRKLRRPLTMSVFHLVLRMPDEPAEQATVLALLLVESNDRWKWMLRN